MVGGENGKKPCGIKKPCGGWNQALCKWEGTAGWKKNNEFTVKIDGEL